MSAQEPQVIDPQEFIELLDYEFSGDSVTVERKRLFIEGFRQKATVYHAAQFAGVARQTVYRWLENDEAFAKAYADSQDDAADVMETSAYERALGREGRADPLLTMFWLKAHRPKFRDRTTVDVQLVDSEIQERMRTLNLKQLPPMTTEFIDGGSALNQPTCVKRAPNEKEGDHDNAINPS